MRPLEATMVGNASIGTFSSAHSSGSHVRVRMSHSIVRLALLTSVANTSPPVSFQISQASMVPIARSSSIGILRFANSHSIFVPEKYGSRTSPVRSRTRPRCPAAASSSHRCAVRRSCHTIALPYGTPVDRFQASDGFALVRDPDGRDCVDADVGDDVVQRARGPQPRSRRRRARPSPAAESAA